ncbi:MAG: branched-chain amino acid ABC transporter permease, partial [Deferribacterales bacterium]
MDLSFIFNDYVIQVITTTGINIIMVLGLNLITGVTGQLSLGHAAFMSIGAYSSAFISTTLGLPFIVALIIGTFSGAIFGAILGIPILRLRGDYLAIATLGFGEIIRVVLLNTDFLGGALGIYGIPDSTNIYVVLIAVIFTIFFMYRLEKSRHGMAIKSIREDEIAAEMMGINIARYKIISFTIGSGFAALGGTLYAHFMTYINP